MLKLWSDWELILCTIIIFSFLCCLWDLSGTSDCFWNHVINLICLFLGQEHRGISMATMMLNNNDVLGFCPAHVVVKPIASNQCFFSASWRNVVLNGVSMILCLVILKLHVQKHRCEINALHTYFSYIFLGTFEDDFPFLKVGYVPRRVFLVYFLQSSTYWYQTTDFFCFLSAGNKNKSGPPNNAVRQEVVIVILMCQNREFQDWTFWKLVNINNVPWMY